MPLPTVQELRTLAQWAPLLGFARRWSAEADPGRQADIVADALEWAAGQTAGRFDDDLARHIAGVLRTPEGAGLVRWILDAVSTLEGNP